LVGWAYELLFVMYVTVKNSSTLLFLLFFFSLGCVCVFLRVYVRAYLAISCASANDNVNHIKSNIRYVFYKKINKMK